MDSSFLLQGVGERRHIDAIADVLSIPDPVRAMISVAFMNERGLVTLESALNPIANKLSIAVGIRNGITTAQGLCKCLDIGCTTYVVDSGSRNVLFHPKVYMARSQTHARILVTSANLTIGGLSNNIESGLSLRLDLSNENHAQLIWEFETQFDNLISEFPTHVSRVEDVDSVRTLYNDGRVVDENVRRPPSTPGRSSAGNAQSLPAFPSNSAPIHSQPARHLSQLPGRWGPPPSHSFAGATPRIHNDPVLVWRSNPLTRRHLNIPTGANTNPTGSMLFGKGEFRDIDQRHYFRDVVFANLTWEFDTTKGAQHIERATAKFQLIIDSIDYGQFELRISHNPRTDTTSYRQHNSMTQLHWGEARKYIATEGLLKRRINLYKFPQFDSYFILEFE